MAILGLKSQFSQIRLGQIGWFGNPDTTIQAKKTSIFVSHSVIISFFEDPSELNDSKQEIGFVLLICNFTINGPNMGKLF